MGPMGPNSSSTLPEPRRGPGDLSQSSQPQQTPPRRSPAQFASGGGGGGGAGVGAGVGVGVGGMMPPPRTGGPNMGGMKQEPMPVQAKPQPASAPGVERLYLIDNTILKIEGPPGVAYRYQKIKQDKVGSDVEVRLAKWGEVVRGIDEGDGWLRVGNYYLPMLHDGTPVITLVPAGEQNAKPEAPVPKPVGHAPGKSNPPQQDSYANAAPKATGHPAEAAKAAASAAAVAAASAESAAGLAAKAAAKATAASAAAGSPGSPRKSPALYQRHAEPTMLQQDPSSSKDEEQQQPTLVQSKTAEMEAAKKAATAAPPSPAPAKPLPAEKAVEQAPEEKAAKPIPTTAAAAAEAVESKTTSASKALAPAPVSAKAPSFALSPSVGTWLMPKPFAPVQAETLCEKKVLQSTSAKCIAEDEAPSTSSFSFPSAEKPVAVAAAKPFRFMPSVGTWLQPLPYNLSSD